MTQQRGSDSLRDASLADPLRRQQRQAPHRPQQGRRRAVAQRDVLQAAVEGRRPQDHVLRGQQVSRDAADPQGGGVGSVAPSAPEGWEGEALRRKGVMLGRKRHMIIFLEDYQVRGS